MNFWEAIFTFRKLLIDGAVVTLMLAVVMLSGGLVVGSIAAAGLSLKSDKKWAKIIKGFFKGYIEIFRGAPLLTLLFFGYYGLAYLGFHLDEYTACSIVLILFAGAYICEIVRSGLESIPMGQWEAGFCLGLNYFEVMRFIIFPQALKIFLPALIGFFISAMKDTSIISLIGCKDIFKEAAVVINRTNLALPIYSLVALFFFIFCFPLSVLVRKLEKRRVKA